MIGVGGRFQVEPTDPSGIPYGLEAIISGNAEEASPDAQLGWQLHCHPRNCRERRDGNWVGMLQHNAISAWPAGSYAKA